MQDTILKCTVVVHRVPALSQSIAEIDEIVAVEAFLGAPTTGDGTADLAALEHTIEGCVRAGYAEGLGVVPDNAATDRALGCRKLLQA